MSEPRALPLVPLIGVAALAAVPWTGIGNYHLHLLINILIWGFIYTSWSVMGRFGMVSLGHGAFLGVGAYVTTLLWNTAGLTPWLGIPIALLVAVILALVIGYPCFRFRIVGHYFALVTLALGEVVRLTIVALRAHTGGSLGMTVEGVPGGTSLMALQFGERGTFFYVALAVWLFGLWVWRIVDRSMLRYALEAASEDEDASASIGVNVTRAKLAITMLSAAMTALGGALYAQYQLYINPETVSGIGISLQIVFAVIAGGMYVQLGPTVGAVITLLLAETLRVAVGHDVHGLDGTIYGLLLVLFIIYMPQGISGYAVAAWRRRRTGPPPQAPTPRVVAAR
jgi:branched-chain amino acid transport system permease protein